MPLIYFKGKKNKDYYDADIYSFGVISIIIILSKYYKNNSDI